MADVAGVILAGGKSTRMGEDKALLPLQGQTLLEHMQALLREARIMPVYISRDDAVADIIPDRGPLGGVHGVLSALETRHNHLLFIPVDMPGLTPALLRQLADAPEDAPLVRFGHYMLPFRLQAGHGWITTIETMLKGKGDVSLRALQNTALLTELPVDPSWLPCFGNANTPQEWQELTQEKAQ